MVKEKIKVNLNYHSQNKKEKSFEKRNKTYYNYHINNKNKKEIKYF